MALDEFIYGKIVGFFKRRSNERESSVEGSVSLENIRSRLTILARATSGSAIEIYPAEKEGGYKDHNFFLPEKVSFFGSESLNLAFYFFRILYLVTQRDLNLNWRPDQEASLEESREEALASSKQILNALFSEYPLCEHIYSEILENFTNEKHGQELWWIYGKWMRNSIAEVENKDKLENFDNKTKAGTSPTTTIKAKAVEEIKQVTVDKKQQEDYVLTHNFEKVETAEEHSGVWRDFDGDDDLKAHENSLDELNLRFTVRVDDTAHSVYQAEFLENTSIQESATASSKGTKYSYDEWDYQKKAYKKNFCSLYAYKETRSKKDYYSKTLNNNRTVLSSLRKSLTSINNKLKQLKYQNQGDEFDLDALTDMVVDLKVNQSISEKIYLDKRKNEKDLSILLLLDVSLSSDSYAAGNRVIDVEKEVSILFGEILNEFNVNFSIHGFFSKTRNHSSFIEVKSFEDSWDKTKTLVGALEPQGYTRIGTSLRHAGALLDQQESKNKWIILLSDGKPNDFDRYEGQYGINDVKQALRELHERRINSYALAIEAQAKYYLPQMFGQNHYQILTNPKELLKSMVQLFEKIRFDS
ncbi:MAG: NorD protein [Bacteroidia bacterium]